MTTDELTHHHTAPVLRARLRLLEQERALAALVGLADNALYMQDLDEETRDAYVGVAVTEIASLRAALGSPLLG